MGRLPTFCPHCGTVTPAGRRCSCMPRPKRKPTPGDKTRKEREPWRNQYGTREYRENRQQAIAREKGRCSVCGTVCARFDGSKWRTAGMGGEVHHMDALCEGGGNDAGRLRLVCKSCHGKIDARRRKYAR